MTKPPAFDFETLAARLAASVEQDAYTILEFCKRHRISVSTFHKLRKEGRGPELMWPGSQCRITREAAAAWREKSTAEGASIRAKLEQARRVRAAKVAAQSPNHGGQKRKKKGND
jgi:hypothetical protein